METVKVSSKYQIVIPRSARKAMDIRPGQEMQVIVHEGRIELLPVRDVRSLRGFLKGIDTTVEREPDRV